MSQEPKAFKVTIRSCVPPKRNLPAAVLDTLAEGWAIGQTLSGSATNPKLSAGFRRVSHAMGMRGIVAGNWNRIIDWLDTYYPDWRGEWTAEVETKHQEDAA